MRLGEMGDNFSLHVNQYVADGDTVVALGTYTWNRKDFGEPAEVQMAHAELAIVPGGTITEG